MKIQPIDEVLGKYCHLNSHKCCLCRFLIRGRRVIKEKCILVNIAGILLSEKNRLLKKNRQ